MSPAPQPLASVDPTTVGHTGLKEVVPEGLSLPPDVPPAIFEGALATFLDERRLDMQALAREIGISRATLYRRVPDRDMLLGEVLWFLTRHAISRSLAAGDGLHGPQRIRAIVAAFMHDLHGQSAFQRFLEEEPEAALRILTSQGGRVQAPLAAATARLIEQETARGQLAPFLDPPTLAYVIVRIGESFLYADVIADSHPDLDLAVAVIDKLLTNGTASAEPGLPPWDGQS